MHRVKNPNAFCNELSVTFQDVCRNNKFWHHFLTIKGTTFFSYIGFNCIKSMDEQPLLSTTKVINAFSHYNLPIFVSANRPYKSYLHLIDMNHPDRPTILMTHEFKNPFDSHITNVAACDDTVVVSLANHEVPTNGHVEFFTPYNRGDRRFDLIGRSIGEDYSSFDICCQKKNFCIT